MDNHCLNICKYQASNVDSPDDREYPSYADDAQYFDIDISLPFFPIDTTPTSTSSSSSDDYDSEDEFELDFSISTANPPNPNHCISSPADNVLSDPSQMPPLQLPASPQSCNVPGVKIHFPKLLRTATRLKISLFGFRKSGKLGLDLQSPCAEYAGTGTGMGCPVPKQNRFFTVKFKMEEVPMVSLFTRDNSINSKRDDNNHGFQKKPENSDDGEGQTCQNMDRDKKRAKEIVQKYVKKIKPPYVQISQRSNDKIRSRDVEKPRIRNGVENGRCQVSERSEKQLSFSDFSGILKMVPKHLGKGKQPPSVMQQQLPNYYRSESTLMEVQNVIQEAIAHCKQSNHIHL